MPVFLFWSGVKFKPLECLRSAQLEGYLFVPTLGYNSDFIPSELLRNSCADQRIDGSARRIASFHALKVDWIDRMWVLNLRIAEFEAKCH